MFLGMPVSGWWAGDYPNLGLMMVGVEGVLVTSHLP